MRTYTLPGTVYRTCGEGDVYGCMRSVSETGLLVASVAKGFGVEGPKLFGRGVAPAGPSGLTKPTPPPAPPPPSLSAASGRLSASQVVLDAANINGVWQVPQAAQGLAQMSRASISSGFLPRPPVRGLIGPKGNPGAVANGGSGNLGPRALPPGPAPLASLPPAPGEILRAASKRPAAENTTALASPWPPNRGFFGRPTQRTLRPGELIDRYGYEGGTFVSPSVPCG